MDVRWLATQESVVLVPDAIVFAWLVLLDQGGPCVTAVKTRHTMPKRPRNGSSRGLQGESEDDTGAPPGTGHRVVVEGLSTCQDSHLTGKPGASQGSPLRVAPGGPKGYGRGTLNPCTRTSYHGVRLRDHFSSST